MLKLYNGPSGSSELDDFRLLCFVQKLELDRIANLKVDLRRQIHAPTQRQQNCKDRQIGKRKTTIASQHRTTTH